MGKIFFVSILFVIFFSTMLFSSERGIKTITGEVITIDLEQKSILVKKVAGRQEYINGGFVDENTEVLVSGKKATLEDIKVKDKVTLFMTLKDEDVYVKKIVKK